MGFFSIAATIVTLRFEGKHQRDNNNQQFEFQMQARNIEKKESAYLQLISIIADLKYIKVEIEPKEDENGSFSIGSVSIADLEKRMQALSDYCNNNKDIMELYFPNQILNEIRNLRAEVYKANEKMPIQLEEFPDTFETIVFKAQTVEEYIKQDLQIRNSSFKPVNIVSTRKDKKSKEDNHGSL